MRRVGATERARAVAAFDPDTLQRLVDRARVRDYVPGADGLELARGVPAAPGRGWGAAYFDVDSALAALDRRQPVVLVVSATSPGDEPVMRHAAAVVTARGGVASHAAIVARGWGVPAVCGLGTLRVESGFARFGDAVVRQGEPLVVDGSSGAVFRPTAGAAAAGPQTGPPPVVDLPDEALEVLAWADEVTAGRIAVVANAESPDDVAVAMRLGAGGVGLCRSEHWFLGEHSPLIAELLTDPWPAERAARLRRFAEISRASTEALLDELDGAPASVRLLDAPPEEFGVGGDVPGGRGVRATRLRSDLYRAQLGALIDVAAARHTSGKPARLGVLVPMVSGPGDLDFVLGLLDEVRGPAAVALPVGAMIEVPRAALTAAEIARRAAFLSIGTNDLTAMVWGLDRDAAPSPGDGDPFGSLDVAGVGRLIGLAIADARAVKPDVEVSVCGEIAGDPASIRALVGLGVTTLSVSPYRVPGARLAAAQALIRLDAGGTDPRLGAG